MTICVIDVGILFNFHGKSRLANTGFWSSNITIFTPQFRHESLQLMGLQLNFGFQAKWSVNYALANIILKYSNLRNFFHDMYGVQFHEKFTLTWWHCPPPPFLKWLLRCDSFSFSTFQHIQFPCISRGERRSNLTSPHSQNFPLQSAHSPWQEKNHESAMFCRWDQPFQALLHSAHIARVKKYFS